jgi:hypothetical protein
MKENQIKEVVMKYKHIEACREIRLWIAQVIVPAVAGGIYLTSIPEVRQFVSEKINNVKTRFTKK